MEPTRKHQAAGGSIPDRWGEAPDLASHGPRPHQCASV